MVSIGLFFPHISLKSVLPLIAIILTVCSTYFKLMKSLLWSFTIGLFKTILSNIIRANSNLTSLTHSFIPRLCFKIIVDMIRLWSLIKGSNLKILWNEKITKPFLVWGCVIKKGTHEYFLSKWSKNILH